MARTGRWTLEVMDPPNEATPQMRNVADRRGPVADIRNCEQCGTAFAPRREHARFCSVRCRVAWNREKMSYPAAEVSALRWSITAMSDTTDRLPRMRAGDRPRAFAVIGEAVW